MNVQKAVKVLTKALREDPGFYLGYQANIAMAFQDEWNEDDTVHQISNNAAKRFLDMWIREWGHIVVRLLYEVKIRRIN